MALRDFTGVATADDLSADIAAIDRDSQAGAGTGTAYSITLAPGATLSEDANLTAINLNGADTLLINGGPTGATLDGAGMYRGFFVYQGTVTIENLKIQNAVAQGGAGGPGAGGGAGLGGGLFVANDPADNAFPSAVTLDNVTFSNDQAAGGAGSGAGQTLGGGGGLGGAGGAENGGAVGSGGGGGIGGAGGSPGSDGSSGIVSGATDGGAAGGAFTAKGGTAGGGGGGEAGGTGGGGGGGIGGAPGTSSGGGAGGFGGGGGGSGTFQATGGSGAGAGGFGGGGGFSSNADGGAGGFGGGGGGGENQGGAGGFGAGNGSRETGAGLGTGGGGLGAGGAIFVQQGASLTISGGKLSGGSVTGGASSSNAGQALGSGIFLQGHQSVTFGTGTVTGQVTEIDDVISDQNSTSGDDVNTGSVIIDGAGTVLLKGANSYTGNTVLNSGTLEIAAINPDYHFLNTFDFAGSNTVLNLDPVLFANQYNTFNGDIVNFAPGDTIDLRGFTFVSGATTATFNRGIRYSYIDISNGTTTDTVYYYGDPNSKFVLTDDGQRGTNIMLVCFVSGTSVRTARGDVAVEHLVIGDMAVTGSGDRRPIRWLGHRTVDCRIRPEMTRPVRIAAHAFGQSRPSRDLFVSPGHAICVDVLSEVLIPAGLLVNGSTIVQVALDEVTYWHVELEGGHDIIFAENLPAESYLDMGNRRFFNEADILNLTAVPDADPAQRTHAHFCRPYVDRGHLIDAVRARLADLAAAKALTRHKRKAA